VSFTYQQIFDIVRINVSANLNIDPDVVDLDFRFQYLIDRMAMRRQSLSGDRSSSDYIEAACIYMDLTERFNIHFFTEYTDKNCITVGDLVSAIAAKLNHLD
jgi:hypothetical protein